MAESGRNNDVEDNGKIKKIFACERYDGRGEPTLQVYVFWEIDNEMPCVTTSVPSSVTFTQYQAREVRDEDGHSVSRAVDNVNDRIANALISNNLKVTQQREIDDLLIRLDSTENLGVNAILGVSVACCKAGAIYKKRSLYKYIADLVEGFTRPNRCYFLPLPRFNMISGGKHSNNNLVCQEFAIVTTGASSFADALKKATDLYRNLQWDIMRRQEMRDLPLSISDEGAYVPNLRNDIDAVILLNDAIRNSDYCNNFAIALDMAANTFYRLLPTRIGKYDLQYKTETSDPANFLDSNALKSQYKQYMTDYHSIISIQDPFAQEDWEGWENFIDQKSQIQVVCDELTAMNNERINTAMDRNVAQWLVLRISQIGTVTKVIEYAMRAKENGWNYIVSASESETEDSFIADMAVGLGADQFSAGAPCRSERMAKYNRLLEIERELLETRPRLE